MSSIRNEKEYLSAEQLREGLLLGLIEVTKQAIPTDRGEEVNKIEADLKILQRQEKIFGSELLKVYGDIAKIFLDTVRMPLKERAFSSVNNERVKYLIGLYDESNENIQNGSSEKNYFRDVFLSSFLDKFGVYREKISSEFVFRDDTTGENVYNIYSPEGIDYVETFFSNGYSKLGFVEFFDQYIDQNSNKKELEFLLMTILNIAIAMNELEDKALVMKIIDPLNIAETPFDEEVYKSMTGELRKTDPKLAVQEAINELYFPKSISESDELSTSKTTTPNIYDSPTNPEPDINENMTTVPYSPLETNFLPDSQNLSLRIQDFVATTFNTLNERFNKLPMEARDESRDKFKELVMQIAVLEFKWQQVVNNYNNEEIKDVTRRYICCFENIVKQITETLNVFENQINQVEVSTNGKYGAVPFSDYLIAPETKENAAILAEYMIVTKDGIQGEGDNGQGVQFMSKSEEEQIRRESEILNLEIAPGLLVDTGNEGRGDEIIQVGGFIIHPSHAESNLFDPRVVFASSEYEPPKFQASLVPRIAGQRTIIDGTIVIAPFVIT